MATEETSLLQRKKMTVLIAKKLKKMYRESFFKSKASVIVLVWVCTILTAGLMIIQSNAKILMPNKKEVFLSFGLASSIYFLFPFFGYLGERFPRHKLLLVGTILTVIGYTMFFSVIFLQDVVNEDSGIKVFVSAATITALILGLGGYGLVYSNFLQFGTTQLQFASSSVLQAYVRWATLSSLSTGVASQLLAGGVVLSLPNLDPLLITNGAYLMIMIVVGIIVYSLRHLVIKESPPAMDPLKLIYKVMRYAKKYNYPVRPSAFTCNDDPPSRLDFAKTRYMEDHSQHSKWKM